MPAAPLKDTPKDTPPKGENNGKTGAKDESKADRFRRIAGKRTADALKAIEKVGSTSRSTTYEYTDEQVDKIVAAMRDRVDTVEKALKAHGGDAGTFAL